MSACLLLLLWAGVTAGAVESPHGPLAYTCAACHTTSDWTLRRDPAFRHDRDSSWPLAGAHAGVACAACHRDLRFRGTAASCQDCHLDIHQGSLGDGCTDCHRPARWFDQELLRRRHERSLFPLSGAHGALDCAQCHQGGSADRFATASPACAACHLGQYQAAAEPDHGAGGFPLTCGDCHGSAAWRPARFDHGWTAFPLSGAHRGTACAACHQGGQYAGTPQECQACHLGDYQAAQNPNHLTAGFPTDCAACHSTAGWQGASFDHDRRFFPIYSGEHRGQWTSCADCHINGADLAEFSCLGCHAHRRSAMDNEHEDVAGYLYDSPACLQCHPDGRESRVRPAPRLQIRREAGPRRPLR
ncbi:MAG: cytochrome c3 family protein [bacterium]|nr:cytochrome c3 family protein [bacterium]